MQTTQETSNEQPVRIKFSIWKTFKHHIPRFLITILIDVVLPLVIFILLQNRIKTVYALLLASSPPLFMVIFKAVFLWTFDPLGFLVFFTFLLSALVAIITHSSILLLLEKSLVTLILSITFLITLIPFPCCQLKPLAYYFYQDLVPTNRSQLGLPDDVFDEQVDDHYVQLRDNFTGTITPKEEISRVYQWIYKNCKSFRFSCNLITFVWALGYFLEFLTRFIMIITGLPIQSIVIYGHIILSTITALCIFLTISIIAIERRATLLFVEEWKVAQERIAVERSLRTFDESDKTKIDLTIKNTGLNV